MEIVALWACGGAEEAPGSADSVWEWIRGSGFNNVTPPM